MALVATKKIVDMAQNLMFISSKPRFPLALSFDSHLTCRYAPIHMKFDTNVTAGRRFQIPKSVALSAHLHRYKLGNRPQRSPTP